MTHALRVPNTKVKPRKFGLIGTRAKAKPGYRKYWLTGDRVKK